jgi:hypothetical protein
VAAVAGDAREQQLAWEARQRPRAGAAAIASAILTVGGYLWWAITLRGGPRAGFLESLGNATAEGPIGGRPSIQTAGFEFFVDRAIGQIGSGVVRGLGMLALAWVLTFLAVAVRARRPEFPRPAVYVGLIGGALLALAYVIMPTERVIAFNSFLDGPRTVDEARDLGGGSLFITGQLLGFIGLFMLAAGLMLVSLNAMRTGLLTRFLGILGIVAGVLAVLPQLMPLPIVQSFWLVALGLLLMGFGRAGLPPAWRTGEAEPWPSAVQAANRRREAEERRQGIRRDEPKARPKAEREPEPVPAARPHPSSKKRKRKRRG